MAAPPKQCRGVGCGLGWLRGEVGSGVCHSFNGWSYVFGECSEGSVGTLEGVDLESYQWGVTKREALHKFLPPVSGIERKKGSRDYTVLSCRDKWVSICLNAFWE